MPENGSISDMVNRVLCKLVDLVEKFPAADFHPGPTIESLVPYLAPVGTQRGDPVPCESALDEHHTKLAGAAVTVLASIIRKYHGATAQWLDILQRLIECWPSTCMGLLFYSRALLRLGDPPAMLEVDSPAHTFASIVTLLQMYTDIEELATLLQETPEVTGLIIRLWALEVRNPSLITQLQEMFPDSCPPTAARLLHRHLFMQKHDVLPVFAVEGSLVVAAIAGVGLEHIRRTTSTFSRHTSAVLNLPLHLRNLMYLHSTHLHSLILSQNSVRVVTEALVVLTSRPFDAANTGALADCVTQICVYLRTNITGGGLVGLNQSLELGLLVGLLKSYPWLDPTNPEFGFFETLLAVQLPKYLIYISVLRQVHKSFKVAQQLGLMGAMPDVHRKLWMAFETSARVRLKLATHDELEMIACGNPECRKPSTMRCSNCWDASYCSGECQMATWTLHREICIVRTDARQNGIPPDLAVEDVQFALRVAQHDFEEHKASICDRWTKAGTLPLTAGIDYSTFPHTVNIDAPSVVREQMTSDAAIYAIFPQGLTGKEYYMCDLGLTRGADTDDRTIAAVVQMVGAQPVPAFFPTS